MKHSGIIGSMVLIAMMVGTCAVASGHGKGEALAEKKCTVCHGLKRVKNQVGQKNREQWRKTVVRMMEKKAAPGATDKEIKAILDWLGSLDA